jgi:D-glycero-D-manno-heptose 1,7-bisphosphate phosphatase
MLKRPAMFLDRDGVIIEDVHHLSRTDQMRLVPGTGAAIRRLNEAGVPVVVVTNQSGVARGLFPESFVAEAHAHLAELLARDGARIDHFEFCPHHPEKGLEAYRINCHCRKPRPGMLLRAASSLRLDLDSSWIVGDKLSDLAAGAAVGCRTVLVRTGHGHEQTLPEDMTSLNFVADVPALPEAVDVFFRRLAKAA